jgi:hypothetical protein
MAGIWSSRFVEPPNAAWTVIAFVTLAPVKMSFDLRLRDSSCISARADCTAMLAHTG